MMEDLFKRLESAGYTPPAPTCGNSICYVNGQLVLGLWVNGEVQNFYITQDELGNTKQLLIDIKNLLTPPTIE